MNIKIEGTKLTIDIYDLVEFMNDETKMHFIDVLSCEEAVIDNVAAQLLGDWTAMNSRGLMSCFAEAEPDTAIDRARRKIAKAANEIACETITKLEEALARKTKALEEAEKREFYE